MEWEQISKMTRLPMLAIAVCALLVLAACETYPPYTPPPPKFDQSWNASLGAAADAGVQVTSADRATGLITGSKGGAAVTIRLQSLADGRVSVAFDAPNASESNPTLKDRWLAAYQRRMGR
jgi:hypothetical protein